MKLVSAIFILFFIFAAKSSAAVFINEVTWMGTTASTTEDEWLELRNDGNESVDLENWTLTAQDGTPNIIFFGVNLKNKTISANGYFLLERTNDQTLPSIVADLIYTGALSNSGETLILKDKNGGEIDRINASSGWPAGDNANKLTMQKISSGWITATGTPKSANVVGQSSSQSSSNSSQENSFSNNYSPQSSSSYQSIASGSVDYHYKNEQISAKAGEDKTAVAGADIVLEGNAFGFKKEPLQNGRYLWNLGDGSYKEGKNIRHIYKYPGNYIAVLNVSSGDISASDRMNIKVIPNELQIIDTKDEFIKLKNKSGVILDISGWFLKAVSVSGGTIFKFPDYSLVAANSELIISSDVSGLKFADNKFSAEILYPNGSVAFSYKADEPSRSFLAAKRDLDGSSSKPKEIILSKPPEKTINDAVVPAAFVISQKNSSNSSLPAGQAGQNFAAEKNLASVITIGEKNNSGAKIWLILAVITGIIGGAGIFLARRKTI